MLPILLVDGWDDVLGLLALPQVEMGQRWTVPSFRYSSSFVTHTDGV